MKKISLLISLVIFSWFNLYPIEPDILVTQEGESLKVYNLDITSGEYIYFSLEEGSNAPLQKILKSDVLIIKKADGTKIDPFLGLSVNNSAPVIPQVSIENPNKHEPVTVKALESDFVNLKAKGFKEPQKFILIEDGMGNILNARLLSSKEFTLSISKPRKDKNYKFEEIIIPEYVNINGDIYTITEIDDEAFTDKPGWKELKSIKFVQFPNTLKKIGKKTFYMNVCLSCIILPESIETIEEYAFAGSGKYSGSNNNNNVLMKGRSNAEFELYIPKSVKHCGQNAFLYVGSNTSPRGYYQGYLSCIPNFITVNNCKQYGIDEDAVEDYERKIGMRK